MDLFSDFTFLVLLAVVSLCFGGEREFVGG
jgi:hypothetical protein